MIDPLDGQRFKVITADCLDALRAMPDGIVK